MRCWTVGAGAYGCGMSSAGKRWSKAGVVCPSPGHGGSRVRFAGHHGPPGHRRQRYLCVPASGDRPHRFTEPLPREESWADDCVTCEREVGLHEGPHAPRNYQFVARGIAESLRMVGSGSTYRDTALVARERAKRLRCDPESGEPRFSRHRVAFRIFCAMGYAAGRPKLWRLEAYTSKSQVGWEAFLATLPGSPPRVVCDNDGGLVNAVRSRFPDADLYLCEWHLRHALERLMGKIRTEGEHRDVIDELLGDIEAAFTGPTLWTPFVERAHAAGIPRLSEWLSTTGRVVEDQFRRRGQRSTRPVEMPLTTSPLDGFINPIRAAIGPSAYGLKNRERTNRLLMLMQLHANRQDDDSDYVRLIRACLEANHGRPNVARRAVIDVGRIASLR